MSLTNEQRETTSRELRANFELSRLSLEQLESDLGLTAEQLDAALAVSPETQGVHVWKLRDYLQEKIEEQGKEPIPYSVLKENRYFPYTR
ncbi:MAG: DUF2316 family protein [Coriobacteriia bacterium]